MAGLSKDDIRFSLEIAREHGFSEVHLSDGDGEFTAELKAIPAAKVSAPVAAKAASVLQVKSAHVGYFRSANPALMLGDAVKVGQVVGSVETLGLLNDIESKVAGHITEIKVTDGDAVDFGKILFTVEP
jgi:biotin carboxyl carrier protein